MTDDRVKGLREKVLALRSAGEDLKAKQSWFNEELESIWFEILKIPGGLAEPLPQVASPKGPEQKVLSQRLFDVIEFRKWLRAQKASFYMDRKKWGYSLKIVSAPDHCYRRALALSTRTRKYQLSGRIGMGNKARYATRYYFDIPEAEMHTLVRKKKRYGVPFTIQGTRYVLADNANDAREYVDVMDPDELISGKDWILGDANAGDALEVDSHGNIISKGH